MQISQRILGWSEFSLLIEWADVPVETGKVPSSTYIYSMYDFLRGQFVSKAKDKAEIHLRIMRLTEFVFLVA